jgi:hypothetical protein
VWGVKRAVVLQAARAELKKLTPEDSRLNRKSKPSNGSLVEYYYSESLKGRFPALFGGKECISPWGYNLGIFRVQYKMRSNRVTQMLIDIGEPQETDATNCKTRD